MKILFSVVLACTLSLTSITPSKAQSNTTYWWNDAVFYEAFVRSYYDTDGNGIGDFKGLTAKLDYISGLGVSAIWLMPICSSPSYHGYDVSNYRQINSQFGTTQDFNDFITAAHNKGIKVIFDFVMNHTSNQNQWFTNSANNTGAYRNYYRWSATNPNYKGPWGQTVWHNKNGSYYYGIFDTSMPDLNYNDPDVKDSMFVIADYWLNTMHIDGFRCDAAPYIIESGQYAQNTPETIQFWKDFHNHYKSTNPEAMAVGEVWMSTDTIMRYVNDGFDFCFEFNLASAILDAVNNGNTQNLISKYQHMYDNYPFAQYGTFLSNHDQDRSYSVLGSNLNRAKEAAGVYLTLPGIPFVYYGEEIGMTGTGGDENKRTPMQWTGVAKAGFTTGSPWENINGNYTTVNVATETADTNSLLNWYKKLISVRNTNAALRRGTYHIATSTRPEVFAYVRSYAGQDLLVVINTSASLFNNQNLNLAGCGIADGTKSLSDLLSNNAITASLSGQMLNGISIAGNNVSVYQLTDYTGTEDIAAINVISIYPNPVDKELNINLKSASAGKYIITICDIAGRQVKLTEESAEELSHPQDVSALPSGVYVLHLSGSNLNRYFKIVKM